jgi:hypothetical protein
MNKPVAICELLAEETVALFEINTSPSDRQLRQFGLICVVAAPLVVWLWTRSLPVVAWGCAIGTVCGVMALLAPRLLKPVFVGLSVLTIPIGLIVGELMMLMIYFGMFLPMAIVFRILGRDALQRKLPENASSFWQKRAQPSGVRRYYRQS